MRYRLTLAAAAAGVSLLFATATPSLAVYTPAGSNAYPGVVLTSPGFLFGDTAAGTSLSDKWYFQFTAPTFVATADASNSDGAYSDFQLSLYRADSATTSTLLTSGNVASGINEDSGLGPITIAPGNYYLLLTGTGLTTNSAGKVLSFPEVVSGNINVQPSPVPLPGALPMFATGLGMLGLLAARRKKARHSL
jgi:hypothetical protein